MQLICPMLMAPKNSNVIGAISVALYKSPKNSKKTNSMEIVLHKIINLSGTNKRIE